MPNEGFKGIHIVLFQMDFDTISMGGEKTSTNTAHYKSMYVAVKYLQNVRIEPNRSELYELKIMKDLTHDNLAKFYGACFDGPKNFILTEFCQRGSLQDVLEAQSSLMKMNWPFRLSLIRDLVNGMNYLHRSPIKSHGALKSSNCLVDSRFAVKIADYGLHFLREYDADPDISNEDSDYYWRSEFYYPKHLFLERFECRPSIVIIITICFTNF